MPAKDVRGVWAVCLAWFVLVNCSQALAQPLSPTSPITPITPPPTLLAVFPTTSIASQTPTVQTPTTVQTEADQPFLIFGHKTLRLHTNTRLSLWEVPFALRPQSRSNAHIASNRGFSYTRGFFPERKLFSSITLNYARHEHHPQESLHRPPNANDPGVLSSVRTRHVDLVYNLHYQPTKTKWFSWYMGVGLGVFAGVARYENGRFEARFEPYPALQVGMLLRVRSVVLGLRVHQSSFIFGTGALQSNQRLLGGFGWLF